MFKIGAIGAGHMGMAVLDAIATQVNPAEVLVYEIDQHRKKAVKSRSFAAAGSEYEVYCNSEILLLALRPQSCEELFNKLVKGTDKREESPVVFNIMSGISSNYIRKYLGEETPVITVIPTLGMKTGQGAAAVAFTDNVPADILSYILDIFKRTGEAVVLPESSLKEIIAVNGCMPGYVFYLIDAFARVAQGVDYSTASRIVARGFIGSALQVMEGGDPKELMGQVCTKGGLTAQGVDYFEKNQLDKILEEGMGESIRRGYELGK